MTTMTKITMDSLNEVLGIAYENRINLFITGRPGIGKTSLISAFAASQPETNPDFQIHVFYAPTMTPIDIQATMPDQESGVLKFYNNEALPNAYTDPDMEGVIFFGELPNADPTVVKSLQKYVNGEDLNGCLRKPDNLRVIADGNRLEDRSGVLQQARAFLSRFMHVEVEPAAEQSIDYMLRNNWHPSVIAFLKQSPALIDKYEDAFGARGTEEAKRGIWASMRSWERVSGLEWWAENNDTRVSDVFLSGNVGTAVAGQYQAYKDVLSKLATKEEVLGNPEGVALPEELSEIYALTYMVALRCLPHEVNAAIQFLMRLPAELQVLGARLLLANPEVKQKALQNQAFLSFITSSKMSSLLKN